MSDQNELAEIISKLQKAEARATAAEGELAKVNSTFGEKIKQLTQKAAAAEAQVAEVTLGYEMDRTLMADGITDPAAIDYIRYSYSKSATGDVKPSFTDFYGAYKEEKKDFLQSFRPAVAKAPSVPEPKAPVAGVGAKAPVAPGKGAVDPSIGVGGKQAPEPQKGAPAAMDASQLASMKPADALAALRTMGLARPAPNAQG